MSFPLVLLTLMQSWTPFVAISDSQQWQQTVATGDDVMMLKLLKKPYRLLADADSKTLAIEEVIHAVTNDLTQAYLVTESHNSIAFSEAAERLVSEIQGINPVAAVINATEWFNDMDMSRLSCASFGHMERIKWQLSNQRSYLTELLHGIEDAISGRGSRKRQQKQTRMQHLQHVVNLFVAMNVNSDMKGKLSSSQRLDLFYDAWRSDHCASEDDDAYAAGTGTWFTSAD